MSESRSDSSIVSDSPTARLAALLADPGILVMPCCYDALSARLTDGGVSMLLPTDDSVELTSGRLKTKGKLIVARYADDGSVVEEVRVDQ